MSIRKALLAAAICMMPVAAAAQNVSGPYIAVGHGWNTQLNDLVAVRGTDFPNGLFGGTYQNDWETGRATVMSVGWGIHLNQGLGLRIEGEVNHRHNNIDEGTWLTRTGFLNNFRPATGNLTTTGLMANALLDFKMGPIVPYIGGGIGYAWSRYRGVGGTSQQTLTESWSFKDEDAQFAYQAIAGVAIPISAVPGLSLTGEYRYFATAENAVNGNYNSTVFLPSPQRLEGRHDNENHSVMLGLRYQLGRARGDAPLK